MKKRLTMLCIFFMILLSMTVFASFNLGEPPEEEIVVETPEVEEQPDTNRITGSTVAEEGRGSDLGYIFFLITLFLLLLATVIYLFQRVNPNG